MIRCILRTCAAVVALGTGAVAHSQAPADSLPCDAWLATIARGVTLSGDWDVLHKVDACERPDSLVVAMREQGVRTLLLANDARNASLHLSYLSRDSAWVAKSFIPLLLPTVTNKSNGTELRGRLMMLIANALQPRSTAARAVFAPAVGETPGTAARCTLGSASPHQPGSALPDAVVASVHAAAQAMVADASEAPQLREAAKCLMRAAADPDR